MFTRNTKVTLVVLFVGFAVSLFLVTTMAEKILLMALFTGSLSLVFYREISRPKVARPFLSSKNASRLAGGRYCLRSRLQRRDGDCG
jgi:hypothetical protein